MLDTNNITIQNDIVRSYCAIVMELKDDCKDLPVSVNGARGCSKFNAAHW